MKRYTLFLLLFCAFTFASSAANAQDNRSHDRRENIEAAKVAFLTEKMNLTPEQSQKFWPLYNEYESKRRELMKNYRQSRHQDVETLSEQEAQARIDNMFSTREKELALEKEYAVKYQRVLSNKQLINLYRGERQFTKMLLKRLDHNKVNQ